ncbi:sialate O-acetylesterase isoform X2 [Brachyhypopomus gauderio]|uniref:sialate O-acetylesterase isoform X2 n=1 Tax=Brachyhypopomus gauderio TaxID=698409 RepID=UPI004043340F
MHGSMDLGNDFRFASYYGDHMVLQRAPERAVVWGYATVGAKVELSLSGPKYNLVNSIHVISGVWTVSLEPVPAGGPYNLTAVQRGSTISEIVLTDILFGDVWLCGGQSNMAFTLAQVYNASEELAMASSFPDVRIFQAALEQSTVELNDLAGVEVPWSRPNPELLGGKDFTHFSAVCWLFGRYLYETMKFPIGLVESCWNGTPIEAWSSPRVLHKCGLQTSGDSHLWDNQWTNGVLWNAMIHPFLKMTIKGVIWYQGEANTLYNQAKYSCTFPALIDDWREMFHAGSEGQTAQVFPFGFVQLCTYKKTSQDGFPEIRWHQTADYGFVPNERMEKTFMAVAMDLPDETSPWGSIHPRDKQDVAYRLVLGARAVAYGEKNVSFQGPFPQHTLIIKTFVNITFDQNITASLSNDTFEICCSQEKKLCTAGSKWLPAPMHEWGTNYVLVSIAKCPVDYVAAVRYAWSDWPCAFKACAIYTADGVLPAPLFLLNRWPENSLQRVYNNI